MSRDIASLIAMTLAVVPASGCPSTWNCHPPEEPFQLEEELTALQVDRTLEPDGSVNCERACSEGLHQANGWSVLEATSCEMELDPAYTPPETSEEDPEREALAGGTVRCEGRSIEYFCEGRRPVGHVEREGRGTDAVGRTLATLAHLEAASVIAFEQLAGGLRAWGAPDELVQRCEQAAREEVRHAALLTEQACRRGAVVPAAEPVPTALTLRSAALANAREGCAGECLAALLAHPMARDGADASLRGAFSEIARDETRHGQLSWDLHAWFLGVLAPAEAEEVRLALAAGLAELSTRARWQCAELPVELGAPSPDRAAQLGQELARRLAA